MAERAVFLILEKLSNPLIQEAALLYGVRDQVEWLRRELRWMESFVQDADAKLRKGSQLVKNWVTEVRDVAHRAEDIIDTFMLEIEPHLRRQRRSGAVMGCIKRFAAFPFELGSRHEIGAEIDRLKEQIDEIKASRERYGLVEITTGESSSKAADEEALGGRRRISPHLDDDDGTVVVGLDVHKKKILETLLDDANITSRRCVPVVGPGGIGKTTLANKVYNTNELRARFQACACVTVSRDYRGSGDLLKNICKQVIDSTTTTTTSAEEVEELKNIVKAVMGSTSTSTTTAESVESTLKAKLKKFLKERRYFIILDDVWETKVWEETREFLPDTSNGSRVLITTRSMDVARSASADPPFEPYLLPLLNDEESLDLFLRRTSLEPSSCPRELEGIGRQLVKRCGGLPLALVALGGIVSTKKRNVGAWRRVAESMDLWGATREGEDCRKVLGLSYNDLPHHHLRSCFLYLGAFPEDMVIQATTVIQLWIAEGFIPQQGMMEDTARNYLEELAQRSMIQVTKENMADGCVVEFQIHDLFRNLCLSEAREDRFRPQRPQQQC